MKLADFDYYLPEELIAQSPAEPRDSARLLHFQKNTDFLEDRIFSDIEDILWENDVLVVNETRVIKARLKWSILKTGKDCEIFLHTQMSHNSWDCLVYPGKKLKPGVKVWFTGSDLIWTIIETSGSWRIVEFNMQWADFIKETSQVWNTPLPPYIKDSNAPDERYQTV